MNSLFPLQPEANNKRKTRVFKKRTNPIKGQKFIDHMDIKLLNRFINDQGKILPARITGLSAYQQRRVKAAIKYARILALLPFVGQDLS